MILMEEKKSWIHSLFSSNLFEKNYGSFVKIKATLNNPAYLF